MLLTGLLVDDSTVTADLNGLAAMALVGRHELDAAPPMTTVLTFDYRFTFRADRLGLPRSS